MNRFLRGIIRSELTLLALTQALVASLTIAFLMLHRAQDQAAERSRDAEQLQKFAAEFRQKYDRWPDRNGGVWELATSGFIDYKANRSDYQRLHEKYAWNKESSRFEAK